MQGNVIVYVKDKIPEFLKLREYWLRTLEAVIFTESELYNNDNVI